MPLMSYYDDAPGRKDAAGHAQLLLILFIVNATFAVASVFFWTLLSLFVAEPIQWATWSGIAPRPDLMDYPFILLWALPAGGIVCAWLVKNSGRSRMACWLAFLPIVLLGLIFGWYYLVPTEWH